MQNRQLTAYQEKDLDEKRTAFAGICEQFPAMRDLRDLLKGDPAEFRRQYPIALKIAVAREIGVPVSGIDILGGQPYVNKTGLTSKVQKDPRQVTLIRAVPILLPIKFEMLNHPDEDLFKRFFLGVSEDGTAMFAGIVRFADGSEFIDQGSANAKFLTREHNKMSTMQPYVMELAATRATNRSMRLAEAIGLVSVEELNARGFQNLKEIEAKNDSPEKAKLVEEITRGFDSLKMNEAKRMALCNKAGGMSSLPEMKVENLTAVATAVRKLVSAKPKIKPKAKKSKIKRKRKAAPKKAES